MSTGRPYTLQKRIKPAPPQPPSTKKMEKPMNIATLNQSSITQSQGAIKTAAQNNNELTESTTKQTTTSDSVELSEEGIVLAQRE